MGGGGGRPASGSLIHSTDLGRAPEEMVVVRGQEGMAFLGFTGYYRYFIKNYSAIVLLFLLYYFIVLRCCLSTNVCGSTTRHLAPFLI